MVNPMPIDPKRVSVLLVEDASVMRKIETQTLRQLGFDNIREAEDGEVAVGILKENPDIDIVISDWNMPKRDGFELLSWIRNNHENPALPFLMATGQGDIEQQRKAMEAGVNGFIAKPFDGGELMAKIKQSLGLETEADRGPEQAAGPQRTAAGKTKLRVAHIQITDHLVLGVLKHLVETSATPPKHFELETRCLSSWNPVAESLENGWVDAACILAPIAMDLFRYQVPIRMIMLAHKNGSIFVRNRRGEYKAPYPDFFRKKFFLIPHKLSIHHMLAHLFFRRAGLSSGMLGKDADVNFEVVAPVKMPQFLKEHPNASGYMVAEPLGTKAIASNIADLQFLSGELWQQHPCCIVAMRDDFINECPDAVHEFCGMLVEAGKFISQKPEKAAEIAVAFLDPDKSLGLKTPLLKNVLTESYGIKTDDLYPRVADFQVIQDYMVEQMGIGAQIDLDRFIDTRFARAACGEEVANRPNYRPMLKDDADSVMQILQRGEVDRTHTEAKSMLNAEGTYLTFQLADQEYGIDISRIKEIIGMLPIRSLPQSAGYIKGVVKLRDQVIPVMDLRLKFGMEEMEYTDRTCIIVLEMSRNGEIVYMGAVVDTVLEVLSIKAADIEDMPHFGADVKTSFISAMAKVEDTLKVLLNIDAVMAD
jgi:chemotaxis signal transduction protein/DNA-binding response OmpR family regulator